MHSLQLFIYDLWFMVYDLSFHVIDYALTTLNAMNAMMIKNRITIRIKTNEEHE